MLEVVEGLLGGALVEEHVALEPPGDLLGENVAGKLAVGDSKDPVKLLESSLLGLGDEEEDEEEGDGVETGVEAKGTDDLELREDEGERHAENGSPEETGGDGETHTGLTVREGIDFGGVGERDGTLAGGVKDTEEVDEEGDESGTDRLHLTLVAEESGKTSGEKSPCHLREGEEQERSATELCTCQQAVQFWVRGRKLTVSMVQKAGNEKSQLMAPKPKDPRVAWKSVMPASTKTVVE